MTRTRTFLSAGPVVPWLVTSMGVGLVGLWANRTAAAPRAVDDERRYLAANRLLHELLDVSRGLSSGLDPVAMSAGLLHDCLHEVGAARGELLVRRDGDVFETLARHGGGLPGDADEDPVVADCWATGACACAATEGPTDVRVRYAVPLRVGTQMVGVVAFALERPIPPGRLQAVQDLSDRRALPLDTALLFDEIRRLATAEERHRLAREIHDGVAQEIASLGYLVDDLADVPEDTRSGRLQELRDGLTRVVDDLRLSIFDLRSEVSSVRGFGLVLSEHLREVGLRSPLTVHLSIDETSDRLPPSVEEELLRIAQEAVTNARRHSGATHLWVTCRIAPPSVELVVEDDGRGIPRTRARRGFGLSIMRERADRIGAAFTMTDRPGGGTRIVVRLPDLQEVSHG